MKEYRTAEQIDADKLDRQIYNAASAAEALALDNVRETLLSARYDVRQLMHKDDRDKTVGSL
jgi:hypothetical protein